jgi:hypothetical protein
MWEAKPMRISDFELSHLILRFEQEKDMKPMHCVQNLAALRDLVDLRIERQQLLAELKSYHDALCEGEGCTTCGLLARAEGVA